MGNNNIIETPEDKKKGNFWSWISLACFAGGFVVDALMAVFMGVLNSITYNLTTTADAYEVTNTASEALIAISGCVSMLLGIAALVIMIYVRVKYPKNIFGKVLMWVYIALFTMYIIFMVAVIIACGIACAACTEECQSLAMLAIERLMLC